MNNYFSKYNLLLFEENSDGLITPYIILSDENDKKITLDYKLLFEDVLISENAKNSY